jgi:hypothetical protein
MIVIGKLREEEKLLRFNLSNCLGICLNRLRKTSKYSQGKWSSNASKILAMHITR